jgi:hypothetical protein
MSYYTLSMYEYMLVIINTGECHYLRGLFYWCITRISYMMIEYLHVQR